MVEMIACCRVALEELLNSGIITPNEYIKMSISENIVIYDEPKHFSMRENSIIHMVKLMISDDSFVDILKDKARSVDGKFYQLWVKYLTKLRYESEMTDEQYNTYLIVEYFYGDVSDREVSIYEYIMNNIEIELINHNPNNLKYINNQTTEMQISLVETNPDLVNYMDNPHFETLMYVNNV